MRFLAKNPKELIIQVLALILAGVLLVLFFFYIYLPSTTNHGETITVPNLVGVHYDDLDEFLTDRNLRYTVTEDSAYSDDLPTLTVLQQNPKPNSRVKENRNVYVTLNRVSPPTTRMPCLIDGSIKNAQAVLKSYGLKLGEIKYKPALGVNSVLEQWYNGEQYDCEQLKEGLLIPKGSKINLVAADGFGRQSLPVPNLIGKSLDEAEIILIGSGLQMGSVIFQEREIVLDTLSSDSVAVMVHRHEVGEIVKQKPGTDRSIRIGQRVDLWVAGTKEEYDAKVVADSLAEIQEYGEYFD